MLRLLAVFDDHDVALPTGPLRGICGVQRPVGDGYPFTGQVRCGSRRRTISLTDPRSAPSIAQDTVMPH